MEIKSIITKVFKEVYSKENKGKKLSSINDDDILLDIGIDSLSYAVIVLRLEEELGFDPFTISKEAYYPQTFSDFVKFYDKNKPK